MKFELSEPYSSRFGKELRFDLYAPVELKVLVAKWPAALLPSTVIGPTGLLEDKLLSHFFFFRDGRRISFEEKVYDTDLIKVMLAATGG